MQAGARGRIFRAPGSVSERVHADSASARRERDSAPRQCGAAVAAAVQEEPGRSSCWRKGEGRRTSTAPHSERRSGSGGARSEAWQGSAGARLAASEVPRAKTTLPFNHRRSDTAPAEGLDPDSPSPTAAASLPPRRILTTPMAPDPARAGAAAASAGLVRDSHSGIPTSPLRTSSPTSSACQRGGGLTVMHVCAAEAGGHERARCRARLAARRTALRAPRETPQTPALLSIAAKHLVSV